MALFRTGNGTSTDTIIIALELVNPDWFRRNLIGALELMCHEENWEQVGNADVQFARDKANEMLENLEIDVQIPVIPIGAVKMWLTSAAPDKWIILDGSEVSRATYAELFDLWGTTFGAGNGTTTFNLPDMVDLSPFGAGAGVALGDTYGEAYHTLLTAEMPVHTHALTDVGHSHTVTDPGHFHRERVGNGANANQLIGSGGSNPTVSNGVTTSTTAMNTGSATTGLTVDSASSGVSIANAGLGVPHNNIHPVRGVHFIAYAGV